MDDIARYRDFSVARATQLANEDLVLRRWLTRVRFGGWPLLVAGIVLPVAAGAAALWRELGPQYDYLVPLFSFGGAACVALHRGLNCEAYQASLKRTCQIVRSVMEDFEAVAAVPDGAVEAAYKAADARLRELRATSTDLPPRRLPSRDATTSAARR